MLTLIKLTSNKGIIYGNILACLSNGMAASMLNFFCSMLEKNITKLKWSLNIPDETRALVHL